MNNYSKVSRRLVQNWKLYKRDFIWRHDPSPYKIMVAEFMLQRTRQPRLNLFIKNFWGNMQMYINLQKQKIAR